MIFHTCYFSEIGTRESNEDSLAVMQSNYDLIAIVADGLGGCRNGEIASRLVVDHFAENFQKYKYSEDQILETIQEINTDIFIKNQITEPMMTTIAALWIDTQQVKGIAANVGDTRIYQFRNQKIVFQSVDHSRAQLAVMTGKISESEIRTSKNRNRLLRAIGAGKQVRIGCEQLSIQSGDRFLLCSDGFWELLTENEMLQTISDSQESEKSQNVKKWLSIMQKQINEKPQKHRDNCTAIAVIIE